MVASVWAFDERQDEGSELVQMSGFHCHLIGRPMEHMSRISSCTGTDIEFRQVNYGSG